MTSKLHLTANSADRMSMKKAVIFDVGGVLIRAPQQAIIAYEEEIGVPRGLIVSAMVKGSPNNAFCQLERGELTLSQFIPMFEQELSAIAEAVGVELSNGFSAVELFRRINNNYQPCVEMLAAAARVKHNGLKTCIITNNWIDDVFSFSHGLPVKLFDCILESSKLGMRKPDPQIYHLACRRLGVAPHEVVFLDDLGMNLKSASSLGITTIKVSDPTKAVEELEEAIGLQLTNSKL